MFFLFDRLEGHRVVRKWVLDVPEIRLVADNLLAAGVVVKSGSDHAALLIGGHMNCITIVFTCIAVIISTGALCHVCKTLVYEATDLERR